MDCERDTQGEGNALIHNLKINCIWVAFIWMQIVRCILNVHFVCVNKIKKTYRPGVTGARNNFTANKN